MTNYCTSENIKVPNRVVSSAAGRISVFGRESSLGSDSRSEAMTIAVGFSPRGESVKTGRRGATLEGSIGFSVQASLRDAHSFLSLFRGLKPTATIRQSLRNFPKSEKRPQQYASHAFIARN